jgi:hypothetical protein
MPRVRRSVSETPNMGSGDADNEAILVHRRLPPSLQQTISNSPNTISTEELREYFECPVCYIVPRPAAPIFACPQGHMMCNICRPRLTHCPICRVSVTEANQLRLYFAERLIEDKVPVQCQYADHGCQVELVGNLLKRHEDNGCPYEPVNCDYDHRGCEEQISRSKKPDHLQFCEYRLIDCPIANCKIQIVQKRLVSHMRDRHFGLFSSTDHLGSYLFLFCLISLLINFLFLYILFFANDQ